MDCSGHGFAEERQRDKTPLLELVTRQFSLFDNLSEVNLPQMERCGERQVFSTSIEKSRDERRKQRRNNDLGRHGNKP